MFFRNSKDEAEGHWDSGNKKGLGATGKKPQKARKDLGPCRHGNLLSIQAKAQNGDLKESKFEDVECSTHFCKK